MICVALRLNIRGKHRIERELSSAQFIKSVILDLLFIENNLVVLLQWLMYHPVSPIRYHTIRAILEDQIHGAFPAFSPGRSTAWNLAQGLSSPAFGSPRNRDARPDPLIFHEAAAPHLSSPGFSSPSARRNDDDNAAAWASPPRLRCHHAGAPLPPPTSMLCRSVY